MQVDASDKLAEECDVSQKQSSPLADTERNLHPRRDHSKNGRNMTMEETLLSPWSKTPKIKKGSLGLKTLSNLYATRHQLKAVRNDRAHV